MKRTFTSASANKYLRSLEDEKDHLLAAERDTYVYTRSAGEDMEPPAYDYRQTRESVAALDDQVRAIRHALHLFNACQVLPESGLTIDEALILLAQLNKRKGILAGMRGRQARERVSGGWGRSDTVEYRYANYDIAQATEDYASVLDQVAKLQLEIDLVNQTRTFEVEV